MLKPADLHIPAQIRGLSGLAAFVLVVAGTLMGLVTFLYVTGATPIKPTEENLRLLLLVNGVLVLLMTALVLGQLIRLFAAYRKGTPGTGLHIRLISLFSLIAALPAILVAVFATVTLNRGLDSWFSERTQAIVDTATTVAEAYLKNASEATRIDVANISADLVQQHELFERDRPAFLRRVARHAALRNLAAAFVFEPASKRVDVKVTANDQIEFIAPTADALSEADKGELVLISPGRGGNVVRALIKLQGYGERYLYIYRVLAPTVLEQLDKTRDARADYDRLMRERVGVQLTFGSAYALVTLVFLLAAAWAGLWFSNRLVAPVVRLLTASREVAAGNFGAQVTVENAPSDLMTLSRTFNSMTNQIQQHRNELISTNEQLDERRRFTEAVLAGVSAGVIGIDAASNVTIFNRSAQTLLGKTAAQMTGRPLATLHTDFADLHQLALSRPSGTAVGQVQAQINGRDVTFVVRITTERSNTDDHGFVLTFDDITELVSAQRNSAWADIARRIAHEIKNPLTPIQLSAERLKRKYLKEITTDKKVFEQCTDTIIRQVGDLGRIVDEFSSFARMPKAQPELNDLVDTVRDATVLQRVSSADIDIELQLPDAPLSFPFDRRLLTQAITNLVKNAREAIEGRMQAGDMTRGHIVVSAGISKSAPYVSVLDNGIGLPQENRHRLSEPYMTTREKGTGLGLAIVKRIMEEHQGHLTLQDAPAGRGAIITLQFPSLDISIPETASHVETN